MMLAGIQIFWYSDRNGKWKSVNGGQSDLALPLVAVNEQFSRNQSSFWMSENNGSDKKKK